MTKVFITQEVSTVDYTPAAKWGELVFVTSGNDKFSPIQASYNNKNIIEKIERVVAGFKNGDLLVCTGSPAVMAVVAAKIGAEKLERVLSWDGRSASYFEVWV